MVCTQKTLRCNFDKYNKKKILPMCCYKNVRNMLHSMIYLLNKHKIIYFLDFGSLLGCVRNEKMIPYDNDVDISILEKDHIKFMKMTTILKNKKYMLKCIKKDKTFYKLYYSYINKLHIDIHFRKLDNNGYYYTQYSIRYWGIHKDDLFPIKKATFENFRVSIPNNAKKYLEKGYGKGYRKS